MPTDNHGYDNSYQDGDSWDYNDEFDALDTDVEVRDAKANRTNYTPKSGAKFLATDTGDVYRGDGSQWVWIGQISDPDSFADASHDNTAHSLAFLSDGDGVERQVWVSSDGTVPSGAADDDIVLTPTN